MAYTTPVKFIFLVRGTGVPLFAASLESNGTKGVSDRASIQCGFLVAIQNFALDAFNQNSVRLIQMDNLMTLAEVAAYLRLSKDTVYRMASSGKLPASKVGSQWRFRKGDVDQWLEKNKNVSHDDNAE